MRKLIDLQKELHTYREEFGMSQVVPCLPEDNARYLQMIRNGEKLPEGIYRYKLDNGRLLDEFYFFNAVTATTEEINEYLTYRRLGYLKTIADCASFFKFLTIIGLILYVLVVFSRLA